MLRRFNRSWTGIVWGDMDSYCNETGKKAMQIQAKENSTFMQRFPQRKLHRGCVEGEAAVGFRGHTCRRKFSRRYPPCTTFSASRKRTHRSMPTGQSLRALWGSTGWEFGLAEKPQVKKTPLPPGGRGTANT